VIRDGYGADLVAWGRVVALTTLGRVSGAPVTVAVGFVEEPDGALLVAAGNPAAHWAANLRAQPSCRYRIGDREGTAVAEELLGAEQARAVVELILKYGTPSENLGRGPAFRIVPEG